MKKLVTSLFVLLIFNYFNIFCAGELWFNAAKNGDAVSIKKLIGSIDVNAQDESGNTALIYAAMKYHENIVKELLAVPGINVNIKNKEGGTALM